MRTATVCFFLVVCLQLTPAIFKYEPNWDSIDARPLPEWYDEAKFGIFMVWGLYSVPAYFDEWFWWHWKGQKIPSVVAYMRNNTKPRFTYPDFGPEFTASLFDPQEFAMLVQQAGAK